MRIDELRTPRLLLRRWRKDDRGGFAEMNADPVVMEHFPSTLSKSQSEEFLERIEADFDKDGFGFWAVEIGGKFAGFTGLGRISFDSPMGPGLEIGWRFASWAWGNGFATEAADRVLMAAFTELGFDQVYAFTSHTNARSEAVMRRIGMSRRMDLDFDHPRTPGWNGARHIVYVANAPTRRDGAQID